MLYAEKNKKVYLQILNVIYEVKGYCKITNNTGEKIGRGKKRKEKKYEVKN